LNLEIDPKTRKITSSTYQKPLNLHLYLPRSSAHPPSVLKGLIYGSIRRFWLQNSKMSDYRLLVGNLFNHLTNRGHSRKELQKLFYDASKNLSNNKTSEAENEESTKRIFFHVQFHPQQLNSTAIQRFFKQECAETLLNCPGKGGTTPINIGQMTVAYKRARNIRDTICRTKLQQPLGETVADMIDKLKKC
jgi:hypothetical protein